jgi:hypothetical protein
MELPMRIILICAVVMALVSVIAAMAVAALMQLFDVPNAELISALVVAFVACPLGFVWGLQLASIERHELANRLSESERALFILSLISALGCLAGVLGEGRRVPATVAIIATIGSLAAAAFLLLRQSPATARRGASPRRRVRH